MASLRHSVRVTSIILFLLCVDVRARDKTDRDTGETEKENVSEYRSQKKVIFSTIR